MARRKPAKAAPKMPARKASAKKAPRKTAKKPARRAANGPVPIVTGRGLTPAQIAHDVVKMIRGTLPAFSPRALIAATKLL